MSHQAILSSLSVLLMFNFFNFFILLPYTFRFYIVPKIEKRIGEKLPFAMTLYQTQPFSKFFGRPFDIGQAIMNKYLIWKFTGKTDTGIWGGARIPYSSFAIMHVNYDIRDASFIEIFMSFLEIFNTLSFFIILFVAFPILDPR